MDKCCFLLQFPGSLASRNHCRELCRGSACITFSNQSEFQLLNDHVFLLGFFHRVPVSGRLNYLNAQYLTLLLNQIIIIKINKTITLIHSSNKDL